MGGEPIKPTAGIFIIQPGCVLLKTRSGLGRVVLAQRSKTDYSSIEPVSSNEVRKVH